MSNEISLEELGKVEGIGKKIFQRIRQQMIKKGKIKKMSVEEVGFPNNKYDVIYADPPWKYDFSRSDNRKIENKYPTMTLKEIKQLPVEEISKDNAVLYLWATAPKAELAYEVIKAWGFEYKTEAIWDKKVKGMGYWWRGQHEKLLVATKGKFSPPKPEDRENSIYSEKRGQHSKKPEHYRKWIKEAFPNTKKIELFARQKVEDWDCWGNEV